MTVVINGDSGFTGPNASNDILANGVTVGKGAGAVATNTVVGVSALNANTTEAENTAVGYQAGYSNTASYNTFFGNKAGYGNTSGQTQVGVGRLALGGSSAGVTGSNNTAVGNFSLPVVTSGADNSALGLQSLKSNTTGSYNTAIGRDALQANTTASNNTAVGYQAAYSNVTGTEITAVGWRSLYSNTGDRNTAIGRQSAVTNTTGTDLTAIGHNALLSNTTGSYNTAVGQGSLNANTTATRNTAVGYGAAIALTTGGSNVIVGDNAFKTATTASETVAIGTYALEYTTGTYNTAVGAGAGGAITTGAKNTIIGRYTGNNGGLDIRTASNYIVLSDGDGNPRGYFNGSGNFFANGLSSSNGDRTLRYTLSNGHITYDTSSARYKDNIRDSQYGLAEVMKLRSTMFEYKDTGRTDVGLIAEEVNEVIPELVPKDLEGRPDAVSYDRMVSVLVRAIQELKATVDLQSTEIASLKAQLNNGV
jgi:trimeric autotransporter adhesin